MPLLSVIVLARDRAADTRRCLAALRRHTPGPLEVVLYDNASKPSAGAAFRALARAWPAMRLVRNSRNLPFARAVNAGMRAAAGEHVCWLNNDALVGPGWREGLESALLSDPRTAAAGPLTSNMAPPDQVARRAGSGTREVPFLGGFCFMLRREAFLKTGPLDERFVWGWEDMDYCMRLRRAGFRLRLVRRVFVVHKGSATIKTLPTPSRRRSDLSNRRLFRRLWGAHPEVGELLRETPAPWDVVRPDISVLVPAHRSAAMTRACLRALERGASDRQVEVVLIAPPGRAAGLEEATLLPVKVLTAPSGTALTRAFNLGRRACRGRAVLLMDPRGRVEPGALSDMHDALRAAPAGSAVGPLSHLTRLRWQNGRPGLGPIPYLRGGCLMLSRDSLARAGGLDERLLWPDAEADLCLRIGRRGARVELVRRALVRGRTPSPFGRTGPAERASTRLMFEKWGAFGAEAQR